MGGISGGSTGRQGGDDEAKKRGISGVKKMF
jgi:hypothetical protein